MRIYQGGNHMKTRDRSRREPESCTCALTLGSLVARSAQALLVSAFALLATAQAQVVMVLGNAHVFEAAISKSAAQRRLIELGLSGRMIVNLQDEVGAFLQSPAHSVAQGLRHSARRPAACARW